MFWKENKYDMRKGGGCKLKFKKKSGSDLKLNETYPTL